MQIDYNAKWKTYVAEVVTEVILRYEIDAQNEDHARELFEDSGGLPSLTEFYGHHVEYPYLKKVRWVREVSADEDTELTTY